MQGGTKLAEGNESTSPISVHKLGDLSTYFNNKVRKPRKALTIDPPVDDKDIPTKIWFGRKAWREITKGWRFERAAWMWIRPDDPPAELKDIHAIKRKSGLDHIDKFPFLTGLVDACRELMR